MKITDTLAVQLGQQISAITDTQFEIVDRKSVNGGCINQSYIISNHLQEKYFVKLNQPALVGMFEAEAKGLLEMAATATIKVPLPICWGTIENFSYLVLEYLNLTDRCNPKNWQELGKNLARMHRHQLDPRPQFGWHLNNTIGSTPQINNWETNWATFFKNHRIGYQFQLANRRGGHFPKADRLLATIPDLLSDRQPQPSLVHGDLWSGNAGFTDSIPVIFDPATYWGDREVDLAMTELFGGFPAAFYQGYESIYPVDPGYSDRKILYNLYHLINHDNLFGGSYQDRVNASIDTLLNRHSALHQIHA